MIRLLQPRIVYYLFRVAGVLVPLIPPCVGYPLFSLMGGLAHGLNRRARLNVRSNLRHVLGPDAPQDRVNQLSRATFSHVAYNYYYLFRLPTLTAAQVDSMVHMRGWENVEAALSLGKGVVMTSAHFGNIEVVLYDMLMRGVSITIPAERVKPPELFEYLTRLRTSTGLKIIPIDGPMTDLFRTLRRGGVAGIAGDRNITGDGTVVDFFGASTLLPDGHVRLAMHTDTPLILGFSRRLHQDSYQARFWPHFRIPEEGSDQERLAAGMAYIVNGMEEAISACPEQWAITTRMWEEPAGTV